MDDYKYEEDISLEELIERYEELQDEEYDVRYPETYC